MLAEADPQPSIARIRIWKLVLRVTTYPHAGFCAATEPTKACRIQAAADPSGGGSSQAKKGRASAKLLQIGVNVG